MEIILMAFSVNPTSLPEVKIDKKRKRKSSSPCKGTVMIKIQRTPEERKTKRYVRGWLWEKKNKRKGKVISQSQTDQCSGNLHRQVTDHALGILWISFNLSASLDWESSRTWTLNENTRLPEFLFDSCLSVLGEFRPHIQVIAYVINVKP